MNTTALINILSTIPPLELAAVKMLKEQRRLTGQPWPRVENRVGLVRVTKELIDYSKRCETARKRLATLPPVPLKQADELTAGYCL